MFCGAAEESTDHLFCYCEAILPDWYGISRWLGWDLVPHSSILDSFLSFVGLEFGKKVALGLILVWLAIVWVLGNSRNDIIFTEVTLVVEFLVDRVEYFI